MRSRSLDSPVSWVDLSAILFLLSFLPRTRSSLDCTCASRKNNLLLICARGYSFLTRRICIINRVPWAENIQDILLLLIYWNIYFSILLVKRPHFTVGMLKFQNFFTIYRYKFKHFASAVQLHDRFVALPRVLLFPFCDISAGALQRCVYDAERERCCEIVNWCNRNENHNRSVTLIVLPRATEIV